MALVLGRLVEDFHHRYDQMTDKCVRNATAATLQMRCPSRFQTLAFDQSFHQLKAKLVNVAVIAAERTTNKRAI